MSSLTWRYGATAEDLALPTSSQNHPLDSSQLEQKHLGESRRSGTSVIHELKRREGSQSPPHLFDVSTAGSRVIDDQRHIFHPVDQGSGHGLGRHAVKEGFPSVSMAAPDASRSTLAIIFWSRAGRVPIGPGTTISRRFSRMSSSSPIDQIGIQSARDLDHLSEVQHEIESQQQLLERI